MSTRILYGVGYGPLGDLGDGAELEAILDFIDPLGIRKVPEAIKGKVDSYVEAKTQRAATVASGRVEAGVRRAMNDAGGTAFKVAAGGLAALTLAGGVYYVTRHARKGGAR